MTTCAAIIIGIDGWERYTLPLIESLQEHEENCFVAIVDNGSKERYPRLDTEAYPNAMVYRTERKCYSEAINWGKQFIGQVDWIIVLSNDVLCTGPFAHLLETFRDEVAGPQLWHEHGLAWIVGWCVCIPNKIWNAIGGWDENYLYSSWEDVDVSVSAIEKGFGLLEEPDLPFVHLDQKQRFGLPGYEGSEQQNWQYFMRKHARVTV